MGRIQVEPQEVERVGGQIVSAASGLAGVRSAVSALDGEVSEPPATAAALGELASEWGAGLARLEEDVTSLGRAGQMAGFLYTLTDDKSIPVSPPPGP